MDGYRYSESKYPLIRWFHNISIAKKLYFVIGIMAMLILIELFALWFSVNTLSSVRAYVGGEGLWSKAQKDAIYHLGRYANQCDKSDYLAFQELMKVPLGDKKARIELEKEKPDMNVAIEGFLEGQNHPDDIEGMIKLFRRFRNVSYIDKAIAIWSETDPDLEKLNSIGERLNREISSPYPSQEKINKIYLELTPVNKEVTKLENDFSYTLGQGSRWLEDVILRILLSIAFTVEITGLVLTVMIVRRITKGIKEVMRVERQVAKGNFSDKAAIFANDEIGLLAGSFNTMTEDLEQHVNSLKIADKKIIESQERYRQIFENTTDIIQSLSPDGTIEFVNQAWCLILGYGIEDIKKGISFFNIIPEEYKEYCKNIFKEVLNDQTSKKIDLVLLTKTGKRIKVEGNINCKFTNGSPKLIQCFFHDITEQQELQEALVQKSLLLQTQTKQLEEAQQISHIGSWEWDVALNKIQWTDELYKIYGLNSKEFDPTYENYILCIHPEDRKYSDEIIQNAFKDHLPFNFHHRIIRPDGSVRVIGSKGKVYIDGNGNTIRMAGSAQDITDQKRIEEAIRMESAYIKLLEEIATASNEATSFLNAAQVAVDKICGLTQWPIGHMCIYKKDTDQLLCEKVWHIDDPVKFKAFKKITEEIIFTSGIGLPGRVHKTKKPSWIIDVTKDENFPRAKVASMSGLNAAFGFPVLVNDEVVAVMEFFTDKPLNPDFRLLEVVSNIGIQLGRVVERERATKELKESEEKFRSLTESTVDSIISGDSDGNIIYFNSGAEKTFGYSAAEVHGKSLTTIMPERFQKDHLNGMKRYLSSMKSKVMGKTIELAGKRKDGSEFPVELCISTWTAKGDIFFTGVLRDISERKKKDEEILKLSLVASNTNNAIMILDKDLHVEWVNDGFTRITGYELKDVKGTAATVLRGKEISGKLLAGKNYGKVFREKVPVSYEAKSFTKDGREYWVLSTLTPIINKEGEVEKVISIDSDITRLKETEELLINAKEQAEDSEKTKEQFLANMSHEIRTPMNAIIGFTRLMEDTRLTAEQRNWLDAIKHSGENLLVIINDILDFSKIEAGKLEFEETEMDIADLVNSTVKMLMPRAQEKNLSLTISIDSKIPPVLNGDPGRLTQILLNLISNAIKFTNEGKVEVEANLLNETDTKATLQFSITDTGIGIPEDKIDDVFESFTQASGSITRKYGGTGLGLTITKELVELQGGELSVKSKYREGSCFSFTLSFSKTRSGEGENKVKSGNLNPELVANKSVLLVEDNPLNQQLAELILKRWKMKVDIADNGKVAIDKLFHKNYDMILMDVQMPEMDGYETTLHIRGSMHKKTPIIAMTAHALKGEAEKCIRLGMNDYISKPFDPNELLSKIIYYTHGKAAA